MGSHSPTCSPTQTCIQEVKFSPKTVLAPVPMTGAFPEAGSVGVVVAFEVTPMFLADQFTVPTCPA